MAMCNEIVVLCGTGSLASINLPGCAAELSSRLALPVQVVVTRNALQFTTQRALEAMSRRRVLHDEFELDTQDGQAPHVSLTERARIIVVYPASANFIARIAHGMADDLASAIVLCAASPVLIVPAMHDRMWRNPATRANVALLEQRGLVVHAPLGGDACGLGEPAAPRVEDVVSHACRLAAVAAPMLGRMAPAASSRAGGVS